MFAVVESGSKQYNVVPGKVIKVEKLASDVGTIVELSNVLAVEGRVGTPYLPGAVVVAEIIEHAKTDKVIVFKKKRRHNYRRKKGHRQNISVLKIKEIKA